MISNQLHLFLIFILVGAVIGLIFDFFRILRITFKTSDIATYVEDIIFWIISGFVLIYSIYIFNSGEIRLYVILGVAFGVILYIQLLSKGVIKIGNIALKPFKFITININKVYRKFLQGTDKIYIKMHKNTKNIK